MRKQLKFTATNRHRDGTRRVWGKADPDRVTAALTLSDHHLLDDNEKSDSCISGHCFFIPVHVHVVADRNQTKNGFGARGTDHVHGLRNNVGELQNCFL